MSDQYYSHKKSHFKSIFDKSADDNLSDFLNYVAIEINREMLDSISELKNSITDLTESNQSR